MFCPMFRRLDVHVLPPCLQDRSKTLESKTLDAGRRATEFSGDVSTARPSGTRERRANAGPRRLEMNRIQR